MPVDPGDKTKARLRLAHLTLSRVHTALHLGTPEEATGIIDAYLEGIPSDPRPRPRPRLLPDTLVWMKWPHTGAWHLVPANERHDDPMSVYHYGSASDRVYRLRGSTGNLCAPVSLGAGRGLLSAVLTVEAAVREKARAQGVYLEISYTGALIGLRGDPSQLRAETSPYALTAWRRLTDSGVGTRWGTHWQGGSAAGALAGWYGPEKMGVPGNRVPGELKCLTRDRPAFSPARAMFLVDLLDRAISSREDEDAMGTPGDNA
jgi:hypothetical protein